MSWARYDDNFDDHPKVMAAIAEDPASITLHTCANTYAHRNHTGGRVPKEYPRRLLGPRGARAARALVNAGLWEPAGDGGGWVFHDWEDYASSDARRHAHGEPNGPDGSPLRQNRRSSADMAELGRRGGKASGEARRAKREARSGEAEAASIEAGKREANEAGGASQNEAPTLHSFPSGSVKLPEPEPVPASRGEATSASKQAAPPKREPVAPQPDPPRPGARTLPPATNAGNELLGEHLAAYPHTLPRDEQAWASRTIERHLAEGIDPGLVRAGLALLREAQAENPDIGAGLLGKFVRQAMNGVTPGMRASRRRAATGRHRPVNNVENGNDIIARAKAGRARVRAETEGPDHHQTSMMIVLDGQVEGRTA